MGLPGAGKTTLCQELRSWLADQETAPTLTPRHQIYRHLLRTANNVLCHWRLLVGREIVSSPREWSDKWAAIWWFLTTLSLYGGINRQPSLLILDEGLLQRSFLIFMEQGGFGPRRRIDRYVASIPLPVVVVSVYVTPAESLSRLRRRRDRSLPPRFRGMAQSDLLRAFSEGAAMIDLLLANVEDMTASPTKVIRLRAMTMGKLSAGFFVEVGCQPGGGLSMRGLWPQVHRQNPHEKDSEESRPSLGPRHVVQLKLRSPNSRGRPSARQSWLDHSDCGPGMEMVGEGDMHAGWRRVGLRVGGSSCKKRAFPPVTH